MVAVGMADTRAANLGAEGEQDGQAGGDADDPGIVDLAQSQHAGVLTVGGVGGGAEDRGQGGGQTVAQQSAVEAGVLEVVALTGGGDGAHVADVLHHGGQGQGHDGHRGGEQQTGVQVGAAEQAEEGVFKLEGQADPGGIGQGLELGGVHGVHAGDLADDSHTVGAYHTQQDGDDLHHALAPDVVAHPRWRWR